MHDVSDALQWQPAGVETFSSVAGAFIDLIADRLSLDVQSAFEPQLARQLRASLENLSDRSLTRVLMAPPIVLRYTKLGHGEVPSIESVLEWFATERLVDEAAHRGRLPGDLETASATAWSAVGDACVFADGTVAHYPWIAGLPPVDFGSPHLPMARTWEPAGGGRHFTPLAPEESESMAIGLASAADALLARCPAAVRMLTLFTRVVGVRADRSTALPSAETSGDAPGLTMLTNYHAFVHQDGKLAEALIHESIHDLLFACMSLRSWGEPGEMTRRCLSPWTGRDIPLVAFLHACFVWFGLWHLWRHLAAHDGLLESAGEHRDRIARGFDRSEFEVLLGTCAGIIEPEIIFAIRSMQENVRAG